MRLRRGIRLRPHGILALLTVALACAPKNNHTVLVVWVTSDLGVPAEIDQVAITATSGGDGAEQTFPLDAQPLPVRLALRPRGTPDFRITVSARGTLREVPVVSQAAATAFVPGQARQIVLTLSRTCAGAGAACPGAAESCLAGRCVSTSAVALLEPYTGTPPSGPIDRDGGPPTPDGPAADRPPPRDSRVHEAGPSGSWSTVPAPEVADTNLAGVAPVAADDVWVVGNKGAQGAAFHFNGQVWLPAALPAGPALTAVWASGPGEVWAVGLSGRILHYSGSTSTWAAVASGTPATLTAIWGEAPNDLWAVGQQGTILHLTGQTVTPATAAGLGAANLLAVSGNGAGDLWAVGADGVVVRGSAARWDKQAQTLTRTILFGAWASGGEVWAVGTHAALHFDGAGWTLESGAPDLAQAVWGAGLDDVWAVGSPEAGSTGATPISRWDGVAFRPASAPTGSRLQAVRGVGPLDVWAVGAAGLVLRFTSP
jgi:hypothetical protein